MLLSHRLFTTSLCIALACKGTESQFVRGGRDAAAYGSTAGERFEVDELQQTLSTSINNESKSCDTATNDAVNWFNNPNNHPFDLGTDGRVWRVSRRRSDRVFCILISWAGGGTGDSYVSSLILNLMWPPITNTSLLLRCFANITHPFTGATCTCHSLLCDGGWWMDIEQWLVGCDSSWYLVWSNYWFIHKLLLCVAVGPFWQWANRTYSHTIWPIDHFGEVVPL